MLKTGCIYSAIVAVLLYALPVSAGWAGYLNTQLLADLKYGYLAVSSPDAASGKLRLICLSDNTFRILFDKNVIEQNEGAQVEVSIDSLPTMVFHLSRLGKDYGIGDQEPEFWKLVAQMAAGGIIVIGTGAGHQYSLSGFTKVYRETCGTLTSAYRYQEYLHLYR